MIGVYVLPGLFATNFRNSAGQMVWGASGLSVAIQALLNRLEALQWRGADDDLVPVQVFEEVELFGARLQAGLPANQYRVRVLPYDWRRLPGDVANRLIPDLTHEEFFLVGHSYGCAVALAIYAQLLSAGTQARCRGIFYLGAPLSSHSSWDLVAALSGESTTFKALWWATYAGRVLSWGSPPLRLALPWTNIGDTLKELLATFPSTSTLVPITVPSWHPERTMSVPRGLLPADVLVRDPGLVDTSDLAAMRTATENNFITAGWLNSGRQEKLRLLDVPLPPDFVMQFFGDGLDTVSGFGPTGAVRHGNCGDDTVTVRDRWNVHASARELRRPNVSHRGLLGDEIVRHTIRALILEDAMTPRLPEPAQLTPAANQALDVQPVQNFIVPIQPGFTPRVNRHESGVTRAGRRNLDP